MTQSYVANKGTQLTKGRHTWKVRMDKVVSTTDVGVVVPSHTNHFNLSKTAWGLKENGIVLYTPNTKQCDGFKDGDIFTSLTYFALGLLFDV